MAEHTSPDSAAFPLANLGKLLPDLEALYIDIHAHPELSIRRHERRAWLRSGLRKLATR